MVSVQRPAAAALCLAVWITLATTAQSAGDNASATPVKQDKLSQKAKDLADKVANHENLGKKLKEELAAQEAQADALSEEGKKLAVAIASQEAQADELSGKVTGHEKSITGLRTEVATLEKDKTDQATAISSLREQFDARSKEVASLEKQLATRSKEKASLQKTQSGLEQDAKKQRETISSEQSKVTSQTATISDLNSQIKAKDRQNSYAQVELKAISVGFQKCQDQYADPSVQHFLHAKAVKVYSDPGIQGARNKTFHYVMPSLEKKYEESLKFMRSSDSLVYSKLNAYVGTQQIEPWLPAVSGILVYGGMIIPFICTVCCLTRIVCKMRPLLLFCHVDFFLTTLCAGMFAFYFGKDPLAAFAEHDASVYLFTQAILGLAFCMYFLLLCLAYCRAKEETQEGLYRIAQILGAAPIAFVYYKHVFTPAMLDEMPHIQSLTAWMFGEGAVMSKVVFVPYVPVSAVFLLLLYLERLCSLAAASGSAKGAAENEMSVVMRTDVELGKLISGQGSSTSSTSEKKK